MPINKDGRSDTSARSRWLGGAVIALLFLAFAAWERAPVHAQSSSEQPRQTVSVVITDSGMELSTSTVPPGSVEFQVRNDASVPYEVEIEGPGVDHDSRDIPAGETHRVTLDLQPGSYQVESEAEEGPDHEWRATLTVQG